MTPDEINRAIADSLGWYEGFVDGCTPCWFSPDPCHVHRDLPNYYNSRDACAEFEKTLAQGGAKQVIHATNRYTNELCKILKCLDTALFQFTTSTAAQRCEAYLRTMGKWKEQA